MKLEMIALVDVIAPRIPSDMSQSSSTSSLRLTDALSELPSSSLPNKKAVRFGSAQVVECVQSIDDLTLDEKSSTWWSPVATKEIHRAAKALGKEAKRNKWMVEGYEHAHQVARQMASSIKDENGLLEKLEDVDIYQGLLDWCKYGHSRRGLERRSSKVNDSARTEAARKARRAVFQLAPEADEESIRRAYERASRSSILFARFMGEADALAVSKCVRVMVKRGNDCNRSLALLSSDSSSQSQPVSS